MSKARVSGLIVAAGRGERLGSSVPKAFVELGGRAILAWSLMAFNAAESIKQVVVSAPSGWEDRACDLVEQHSRVRTDVVTGGPTRSHSVLEALACAAEAEIVVIHDAARPFVDATLITRCVDHLIDSEYQGVVAALPVRDTVKRAGSDQIVIETPDRGELWAAQTPQAFRAQALRTAFESLPQALVAAASDDAVLAEQAGGAVKLITGSARNFKVTTAFDLELAEALVGSA